MRSIGRDQELERAIALVTALRTQNERKVHFSVSAPPHGGLSLFLQDLADACRQAGDLVLVAKLDDSRRTEDMFSTIIQQLSEACGKSVDINESSIETLLLLAHRFAEKASGNITVLMLDIAAALRGIAEDPELRRDALSNPLLQKLRTLVNLLQDREPPIAVILGWDDRFREHAPDWRALDVVQRYPQIINLFADYGIGRGAWKYFRGIFEANGLELKDGYPGICGSGLPAGSFVVAAAREGRRSIDGEFLLNFLLASRPEADRLQAEHIPRGLLVDLCLRDSSIPTVPADSGLRQLVQLSDTEDGYLARRELYQLLGLTPPREIVSFDDRVRLRLEDGDPELANEVAYGIAAVLADGRPSQEPEGGLLLAIRKELLPIPLRALDARLVWSFASVPESGLVQTATKWVAEGERDPSLGARRILIVVHTDPAFRNAFMRGLVDSLAGLGIGDPRPRGAKAAVKTQARILAGALAIELDPAQIVSAAWRRIDPTHPDELGENLGEKISKHYDSIARLMPRLSADFFDTESLPKLIAAFGAAVEIERLGGDRLKRFNCISPEDGGRYRWRWRSDEFLGRLSELGRADASSMAGYYFFDPEEWPAIAAAIHRAYGDDLIAKEGDILKVQDPLRLLQAQYVGSRERLLKKSEEYLRSAPSAQDQENWRLRLADIAETPPQTTQECEDWLDRILSAEDQLQATESAAADDLVRRREQLQQLYHQLEKERPPADLSTEFEQLRKDVSATLNSGRDAQTLCQRGESLIRRSTRSRTDAEARSERLISLRGEITELRAKAVGRPVAVAAVESAAKRLEQSGEPAEEIAAEIEQAKILLMENSTKSVPVPPAATPLQFQVFRKTEEDLARLADLYRRKAIKSAEVR